MIVWPAERGREAHRAAGAHAAQRLAQRAGARIGCLVTVTWSAQVRRTWSSSTGLRMPPRTLKARLLHLGHVRSSAGVRTLKGGEGHGDLLPAR